jgi:hypothetical protein
MLQFCGSVVTSDAGLLAHRELDDVLGPSTLASDVLADARIGKNGRLVPSPSTACANGAGLPKTRKRGKLANDPAAIW